MEVLVADDGLDVGVVLVGGDLRIGERVAGVEDVEALVLHGAEVEVVRRHDAEAVEVKLEPPALLVPADGLLEAVHRVLRLVDVLRLDPDFKAGGAAVLEDDRVAKGLEPAGDEREEIAGLRERILPAGLVAAVVKVLLLNAVAVGEQHGVLLLRRADHDAVAGEDVGPVEEVGDAAEALGLALAHQVLARGVDARERLVGGRAEAVDDDDVALAVDAADGEQVVAERVAGLVERKAVDGDADERQGFAVENEIGGMLCIGIRTHVHGVDDARAVGVKVKLQMHRVDQMGRRAVVGAEDGFCHLCSQYVDAAEHVRR